jgi:O-antigen/teichoic acid export membrane protein
MSIRSRLFRGIAANGFGQLINAIIQLAGVPIFIHFWGIELYGEWLILSAMATYLASSDIGFSTVAANDMTMQVSRGNRSEALVTFNSTWIFITSVSLLVGILLLPVIYTLPIEKWFSFKHQNHSQVISVVILLTLYVLVGLQTRLMMAGFRCDGNYAKGEFLNHLVRLSEFGSVALAVYFGAYPVIAAMGFLGVRCLGMVVIRIFLGMRSPWIIYDYRQATLKAIKRLARPAVTFMALPVGMILKDQGMITVLGITLGPLAVTVFSTVRTLVNAGYQLMGMINQSVWPEISIAFGANDLKLARQLHRQAYGASFWMALLFVVVLFFSGAWIIRVWTMGKIIPDFMFFHLMLMNLFVESLWSSSSIVAYAINKHEKLTVYYLCMAGGGLLIAVWLVPLIQLSGAVLSLLALNIFMGLVATRMALNFLEDNFVDFFHSVTVSPVVFYQQIRRGF